MDGKVITGFIYAPSMFPSCLGTVKGGVWIFIWKVERVGKEKGGIEMKKEMYEKGRKVMSNKH